jgi:hypothetical protein
MVKDYKKYTQELLSSNRQKTRFYAKNNIQKTIAKLAERIAPEKEKKVIFFGDGTFGNSKGCAPVPKKKIIHQLCIRKLTFMLGEHGTSKYCPCKECNCEMKDIKPIELPINKNTNLSKKEKQKIKKLKRKDKKGLRLRRCASDPKCSSPCYYSLHETDRDESAITGMGIIVNCALTSDCEELRRPLKYCKVAYNTGSLVE